MSVVFKTYTLTYDEGVQGFPSFYSYEPDWMIGMNNYFYTFNGGDIYRHNVNESRNTFYEVTYPATVRSVFNDNALENKLFKTINLEGDSTWGVQLATDIKLKSPCSSFFIKCIWLIYTMLHKRQSILNIFNNIFSFLGWNHT